MSEVSDGLPYQHLADAVLALHVGVVVFVVAGLGLTIVGNFRGWHWVNDLRFRLAHLAAIGVVVAQAWFGAVCPLTSLEMWLRAKAHLTTYSGSFIEHWLQRLLYYDAPSWMFTLAYSLFGLLVFATWWYFPPTSKRRRHETDA
jgi:polyferredoxin